jgi:hypothetical protein
MTLRARHTHSYSSLLPAPPLTVPPPLFLFSPCPLAPLPLSPATSYAAPDNDRMTKESGWLTTQAWFEGLRHYPKGTEAIDSEKAYSGLTHAGGKDQPTEHLQTDLRARLGLAKADPEWRPSQLQESWAPESPALAKRLNRLANRLRAPPVDSADEAARGENFTGPDLWA